MPIWRLIESLPADIFSQMSRDRDLFEEFVRSPGATPLLRIYQVRGPAVTAGRFYQNKRVPPIRSGGFFIFAPAATE